MMYTRQQLIFNPGLIGNIPVPRVLDTVVKSIVYLYSILDDAENARPSGGTAFLVGVPFERRFDDSQYYHHVYMVTNAHVIEGGVQAMRLNRRDGSSECFDISNATWTFHPDGDDVAVTEFATDYDVFDHVFSSSGMLITREFIKQHEIGIGDDIFVIGRFRYHEGRKRNYPSARFGYIAQMPDESILVKRSPIYTAKQEAFLVEMRSIGGYSGSPVFLYIPPMTFRMTKEQRPPSYDYHIRILGVDFGHLPTKDPIRNEDGNQVNGWYTQSNSAMTGVVPAWKIQEIFDMPTLVERRKKTEERFAKQREDSGELPIVLDAASDNDEELPSLTKEEFERVLRKATRPIEDD